MNLFNLVVVNERTLMGKSFKYETDRYMENIIKHGASRCYVFQSTVLVTGILLMVLGPLGIESHLINLGPNTEVPDGLVEKLKPYRIMRKRLATFCLFLVITAIILGMQVYNTFGITLNIVLIVLAGVFAWRVNKSLILFGWI